MDTMATVLIVSAIVVVSISVFLWFNWRTAQRNRAYLQQIHQKDAQSSQAVSRSQPLHSPQPDFIDRTLNSPLISHTLNSAQAPAGSHSSDGWQQSGKGFDAYASPSQRPADNRSANSYIDRGNSRPGLSVAPYSSSYAEERPRIVSSGNRGLEHYAQRIHASYEPRINGISLVFTDTVITNAVEVDNVFKVCEWQFQKVMKARGWERVGWIGDLADYTLVGTEATTLVGERLKLFLDTFGLKTKGGLYLISHYSSKATPPEQEALQEKLKRIQFMTAGVINNFHGHVFDTREEAIAFYLRLRQEFMAGR